MEQDRLAVRVCLLALALLAPLAAQANDRPFLLTSSAAAEEDDDAVWSVETRWQRVGKARSFSVAPEYAFDPTNSLQAEFTVGHGGERELELEARHLFNHIERDGYGWGLGLSWSSGRDGETGGGWRSQSLSLKLPFSVSFQGGDTLLHLNAGVLKPVGEKREWVASAAVEQRLAWRTSAFAEVGREDHATLLHAGVRHWIQRERLALDVSVLQQRADGQRSGGLVVGLNWYDL